MKGLNEDRNCAIATASSSGCTLQGNRNLLSGLASLLLILSACGSTLQRLTSTCLVSAILFVWAINLRWKWWLIRLAASKYNIKSETDQEQRGDVQMKARFVEDNGKKEHATTPHWNTRVGGNVGHLVSVWAWVWWCWAFLRFVSSCSFCSCFRIWIQIKLPFVRGFMLACMPIVFAVRFLTLIQIRTVTQKTNKRGKKKQVRKLIKVATTKKGKTHVENNEQQKQKIKKK